jgi:hypothetical protein
MESVGFKEWAIVCDALGRGEQRVIIRKGGIAEGRDGFSFRHREFFLFPTFFHEQVERTRLENVTIPAHAADEIEIRYFARIESAKLITDWWEAEALAPLHVLKPDVVRERFGYGDSAGLHVAWVRVFRLEPFWILPNQKSYAGCRSWVKLPDLPAHIRVAPVADQPTASTR